MPSYWMNLERDEEGRWIEDDIPNQKERPMATRKTDKTDDEKATDQREIQTPDAAVSDENSTAGSGSDDTSTTPDAHVEGTGDPHASDSDLPVTTGIDGEAFPDRAEPINSDEQTVTVQNDFGTEYQQPKFRAVRSVEHATIGISLYNWVGPEALTIPESDLDDLKAFIASL